MESTAMSIESFEVAASGVPSSPANTARMTGFLTSMSLDLQISGEVLRNVSFTGDDDLPSVFPVSDFATAAMATAAAAVGELVATRSGNPPRIQVSRRLASLWFGRSIGPIDWKIPDPWDPIAGDYRTADGWIRLHTNAPHHREAALQVLNVAPDKAQVARAVAQWASDALEAAVLQSNGCAAAMRSLACWATHPVGQQVAQEPLLAARTTDDAADLRLRASVERPLSGLKVLDLTRVLAGPVATRFLAGFGADVLRIDPPTWEEAAVVPDVTLGKRCARLDLKKAADRDVLIELLRQADVLVHGYRADALERLGLDAQVRRQIRPGLVDVCLNAYGWHSAWRNRRGFDSLVQMSTGIADAGMAQLGREAPMPLPVQALDQATGYLMAAAVVRGVTHRLQTGNGFEARASLTRTASLLVRDGPQTLRQGFSPAAGADWSDIVEKSDFGASHRLRCAVTLDGWPMRWALPAAQLGSSPPRW